MHQLADLLEDDVRPLEVDVVADVGHGEQMTVRRERLGLTAREVEVLALVSAGLTRLEENMRWSVSLRPSS